jgi:hypothetical protein
MRHVHVHEQCMSMRHFAECFLSWNFGLHLLHMYPARPVPTVSLRCALSYAGSWCTRRSTSCSVPHRPRGWCGERPMPSATVALWATGTTSSTPIAAAGPRATSYTIRPARARAVHPAVQRVRGSVRTDGHEPTKHAGAAAARAQSAERRPRGRGARRVRPDRRAVHVHSRRPALSEPARAHQHPPAAEVGACVGRSVCPQILQRRSSKYVSKAGYTA